MGITIKLYLRIPKWIVYYYNNNFFLKYKLICEKSLSTMNTKTWFAPLKPDTTTQLYEHINFKAVQPPFYRGEKLACSKVLPSQVPPLTYHNP